MLDSFLFILTLCRTKSRSYYCIIYISLIAVLGRRETDNSMEQSPSWEAYILAASQVTSRILGNPSFITAFIKARHLSLSRVTSILSLSPHNSLEVYFNIILPSTPWSYKWFLSLRFFHQNPVCTTYLPYTCHILLPSHYPWFYQNQNIYNFLLHNY